MLRKLNMNKLTIIIICIIGLISCNNKSDIEEEYNLENPTDFIIGSFKEKDIIFLGEFHRIKNHMDFVKNLIPVMAENGITILVSEFSRYEDTPLLDSLMCGQQFDNELAKKIMINHNWTWQYQEYFDILRIAWKVNSTTNCKFRIIGMNNSCNYDLTPSDDEFWGGDESDFAKRIVKEVLSKNKKALVHCGIHHSLTKYVQPKVDSLGNLIGFYKKKGRVGQILYNKYPNRCMNIWLHSPLFSKNMEASHLNPLNGKLDSIYKKIKKPYAFNTHKSVLGRIKDESSYYSVGHPDFNLEMITDGYIVPCSFSNYEFVHRIKNYVDSNNIGMVQKQAKAFEKIENISIDTANYYLKDWFEYNLNDFNKNKEKYWQ